jgi:hypothetical protein
VCSEGRLGKCLLLFTTVAYCQGQQVLASYIGDCLLSAVIFKLQMWPNFLITFESEKLCTYVCIDFELSRSAFFDEKSIPFHERFPCSS